MRVANIYDLSSKIILFKFAKPDTKKQFIFECGFRCHLTDFTRTTAQTPSGFVSQLRKILKTRRVSSVSQVGTDRVIEFQFSDGQYFMYLEFFAVSPQNSPAGIPRFSQITHRKTSAQAGNLITTDADHKILAIMRNVPEGEGQEPQRVGMVYSTANRINVGGVPDITSKRVKSALEKAVERQAEAAASGKMKKKKKACDDLRRGLALTITELPPILVQHAMLATGFDGSVAPQAVLENTALLDELLKALQVARLIVEDVGTSQKCKGYIVAKVKKGATVPDGTKPGDIPRRDLVYEDFHPFLPRQFEHDSAYVILTFEGFNRTVDEFFSSIESQKLESRLANVQANAQKKLEAARRDQARRIDALQCAHILNFRKAAAIEANAERIQEAMDAVIDLIEQGKNWNDIDNVIKLEQRRGNPIAEIIKLPLKLSMDTITLILGDADIEQEVDDDSDVVSDSGYAATNPRAALTTLEVDINLKLTPWANAGEYYIERRAGMAKEHRTAQANAEAMKNVERRVTKEIQKGLKEEKPLLQLTRSQCWFEKFLWFISSDEYLVLGGRDPNQNEILYRKYLHKGDVYVHADINGAGSVVIKNKPLTPDAPIPPATLQQAGTLAVCPSSAWDSKAGMSAWWANAAQMTKFTPSGDILPTGMFAVKGEKNFLPPAPLVLGLGLLWKISDGSKAQHVKHRNSQHVSAPSNDTIATLTKEDQECMVKDKLDDDEDAKDDSEPKYQVSGNPVDTGGATEDVAGDEVQVPSAEMTRLVITNEGKKPTAEDEMSTSIARSMKYDELNPEEEKELGVGKETKDESENFLENSDNSGGDDADDAHTKVGSTPPRKHEPLKRGRKSKLKKMAKKYKDQDEEDRVAAEQLLGSALGRQRREDEAKAKEAKAAELKEARASRREQHRRVQEDTARDEAQRQKRMVGGGVNSEEEDAQFRADMVELADALGTLVGTARSGDDILEVVPVCAPYSALSRVKYKTKMQPGATKKGKAVRDTLERWKLDSRKKGAVDEKSLDRERMWPREVELLTAIRSEEVINIVPVGKLAVMGTGASGGGGGKGKGNNKGKRAAGSSSGGGGGKEKKGRK